MRPTHSFLAALLLAGAAPLAAAQDLGGLLRSINPSAGQVLQKLAPVVPAGPAAASASSAAGDLLQLLADSVDNIDEPREIEIGRQLAAVLLGSKPLAREPALQRYVNRLGRWLSLQSTRPQLPWVFSVLDDPGFNAFAAPGGFVFVTRGLVDRVDESELAAILAHEITHVTQRHHLQALRAKARAGALAQLLASQARGSAAMAAGPLAMLGRELYASGLDQADEYEADRLGVTLAASAGFDPYGLPSVLQQLRAASPDNPVFAFSLSTHPPAQQRLEQLEAAMGNQLDAFAGQPSVPVAQRLRAGR